jgi:hypothetical protein
LPFCLKSPCLHHHSHGTSRQRTFDEVAESHRRLEAGGLEGKLVLCPDVLSQRDRDGKDRVAVAIRADPV